MPIGSRAAFEWLPFGVRCAHDPANNSISRYAHAFVCFLLLFGIDGTAHSVTIRLEQGSPSKQLPPPSDLGFRMHKTTD